MEQPSSLRSASNMRVSPSVDSMEPPSINSVRRTVEQPSSLRSASGLRASPSVNSMEQQPSSARSASGLRASQLNSVEQIMSSHSVVAGRSSQSPSIVEEVQPPSASSHLAAGRTPQSNVVEQSPSARSRSHPQPQAIKTVPMVPPVVPLSLRSTASTIPAEVQSNYPKDKR